MKRERAFLKTLCRTLSSLHHHKPLIPKMDPSERYCYNPTLRWNPQVEEYFVKAYGADHFARISKALTQPSCYSCIRVNTLKSTSDSVIKKLCSLLQENGWQSDPSKGTNAIHSSDGIATEPDGLPDASVKNSFISKCKIPCLDYVIFVQGSGPHTIDYGYKEDKPPKEVIVSRKCAEAVLRGAHVYVPGVLACSAHVEKGEQVAVSVAVEQPGADGGWGVGFTRGTVLQGSQTDPFYFERNGLYIGQGVSMMSRAGMFRVPQGVALDLNNRVFNLPSFNDLLEGEIFLQNLPSIITAHALDPQEGEKILDMCAAPGGKTTAIAILMKDKGEVIAADRSHNKVLEIQKLAAELGLKCITTYKLDALKSVQRINKSDNQDAPQGELNESIQNPESPKCGIEKISDTALATLDQPKNEKYTSKAELRKNMRIMRNGPGRNNSLGGRVEKSKGFLPNSFDRVLLDAPCSALGLRPRLFSGEDTMESLRSHAKYQRRMFDQAVQLVRPGGVIVYSTCTINPGENEALVRYALDTYKFLSLASQHPKVGGPGLVGSCQFSDGYQEEWLRPGEEDLVQRFDPSSELDTMGFFIAKFNVGTKDI
ncbi:rRNA (cytosine-C(5))-methyltransferase NOP2C isoform X2 [Salvia miltiorrhiza]|uniref:rRNA (cytosine-C(5))-methyltransferase NOP2C isoform X2 n=1 Tax=Salvia miltiorrhiza TaxID=226208 RepID=UPI0025AC4F14|nr:rRNA (cytosine-C(5))-methyltransferase NOP2C isoform X2 [Salvia miltiorrhiza]